MIRDCLSVWDNTNFQNSIKGNNEAHINSQGTSAGEIRYSDVKKKVTDEFSFFNNDYWESRSEAFINFYLIGHGNKDYFPMKPNTKALFYDELIKHLISTAEITTDQVLMPYKKLMWNFNWYIDACFGGACINRAMDLVR